MSSSRPFLREFARPRGTAPGAFLFAAALLLAGCAGSDPRVGRVLGPGRAVLEAPDRVEAFRVRPLPDARNVSMWQWPADPPVPVDATAAAEISALLRNPAAYEWDRPKACKPVPGIKLRFHRGREAADVLLCFECLQLFVSPGGSADFDPSARDWVRIVKGLFPKDPVVQSLK